MATDIFGRGIDIDHVNIVINYDMPVETDSYLHRVKDKDDTRVLLGRKSRQIRNQRPGDQLHLVGRGPEDPDRRPVAI